MNKNNVIKLANFLENSVTDEQFAMDEWACGTTACIGGWCDLMQVNERPRDEIADEIHFAEVRGVVLSVGEYLGLSRGESRELTMPKNKFAWFLADEPDNPRYVSRQRAVVVLCHLAETGRVDWSVE